MEVKEKKELKKFIKELEGIRGRHTELVSVYIPAGYELIKIIQHLQEEQGTASNIKDKTTRTHVIDSLERMIRHLRLFKKTPANGLAAFAGNVSEREGQSNIQVWSIEPPKPMKTRTYRCDQTFQLDLLKEMMDHDEVFGLIVVDKREGNIGFLKGNSIIESANFHSNVPGKTTKGGQCIDFDSIVQLKNSQIKISDVKKGDLLKSYNFFTKEFEFSECLDRWDVKKNEAFLIKTSDNEILASKDHLFFLSNGETKATEDLGIGDCLLNENAEEIKVDSIELKKGDFSLVDISVKNQNFIANCVLVHNSQARYARIRELAAKDFFNKIASAANKEFLEVKTKLKGILVGGPGHTKNEFVDGSYLNQELKDKVIAVQDLSYTGEFGLQELVEKSKDILAEEAITEEKDIMNKFLDMLSKDTGKAAYGEKEVEEALKLGAVETILISEEFDDKKSEEFEKKAENTGAVVRLISTETREGVQLKDLGGIAAILRFAIV
ncbi:MAG: hypothetical protein ABIJ20_02680 [Nanoarchaeota archaeon]|nr:hypothetical protein [Nanoarchaeota archaeon]MBU1445062.1 hypothetical protein [Nanoarchaeota archaeon]MBU2406499.1 hypothetical protein [Nanoarchaeota archaeon]MBU2420599.1 hypothetical protein [Nanoarchaeota archaeon]MBU2475189.1 hypothetical protein [Nanoarchaeota archaeon]